MNELYKISEEFAQSVYLDFTSKRFGIKGCQNSVDYELAGDLMEILKRKEERVNVCCLTDDDSCSLEKIKERINTL